MGVVVPAGAGADAIEQFLKGEPCAVDAHFDCAESQGEHVGDFLVGAAFDVAQDDGGASGWVELGERFFQAGAEFVAQCGFFGLGGLHIDVVWCFFSLVGGVKE